MSQYNFGNLESPLSGGTFINTHLEPWRDALHSTHKGNSRPGYAIAGTQWINDTTNPWVLNLFDGADDIPLGTFNTTSNQFTPSNSGVGDMLKSDNLSGLTNYGTARSNLGLGSLATLSTIGTAQITALAVTNAEIANSTIALGKLANIAANTLLGNATGSAAAPSAITVAANKFLARASTGDIAAKDLTDFALTLLDDADAAAMKATLGITSGAFELISTANPSGASQVDFTGLSSTYWAYKIVLDIDLSTNAELWLRHSINNGSSFLAAGGEYEGSFISMRAASTTVYGNLSSSGSGEMILANSVTGGGLPDERYQGTIDLINYGAANTHKTTIWDIRGIISNATTQMYKGNASTPRAAVALSNYTNDVDAVRLLLSTGTITGTVKLYGIRA